MDHKPKLIVFDLDLTLWPFYVDSHYGRTPFGKDSTDKVHDKYGQHIKLYPDTLAILEHLHSEDYQIVVASRTSATKEADSLLELFDLNKFFTIKQIFPGKKTAHFSTFHKETKVAYEDMLFFDDEERNIIDLTKIGVTCHFITHGITWKDLNQGLETHMKKKQKK